MCLSIPGKVVSVGKKVVIDYGTEKREVEMNFADAKVGDYVIVNNKIIISKMDDKKAKEFLELLDDRR